MAAKPLIDGNNRPVDLARPTPYGAALFETPQPAR
jgi:hypothetical protein